MNVYSELDLATNAKLQEITSVKHVEEYNGQYLNTETEDAKLYPAVYHELLEPIIWNEEGNDWQSAKIRTRIHVVVFDLKRTKADLHTVGQDVFLKMEGVTLLGTGGYHLTSKWNRVASTLPKRYKQLKVLTIDFEYQAFDSTSMQAMETEQVGFTIVPAGS
jgi:hypothetical protein